MRILVNDVAASSGGALTILRSFYKFICESKEAQRHTWIFLISDDYIVNKNNIRVIVRKDIKRSWVNRLRFDLIQGKNLIENINPDFVISLQNTAIFGLKCPQIIYLHQAIPFQKVKRYSFFKLDEFKLAIYQYVIGHIIKKSLGIAEHIIVQTKWMKSAIIEQTNVDESKITNILPPIKNFDKNIISSNLNNSVSFFYPAENLSYKNHKCIIEAVKLLRDQGINNFEVMLTIDCNETHPNIRYLGKIPYEKVLEKYKASTLIFPSYIETIGLPLLEARQLGTLILASDTPFSREALENYSNGYFFNPFKSKELSELMSNVLNGSIARSDEIQNYDIDNGWDIILKLLESEG